MHPVYILYAVPFFFLLMGAEWLYGYAKKKDWYRLNDSIANLVIGMGSQIFGLIFKAMLLGIYIWFYNNYRVATIPATWWSFLLALLAFDFFFYWAHRWGHEVNIFWGAHSVHHQSEEYNLSVALRQSWFHNLLAFPIFLAIPILGFDPLTFGLAAIVHTLYQFWIHTKSIDKMHPWIEYWLNTPSHHRVHHSIDPQYIDKNHAGLLMIWDRMFGTFKAEETGTEIHYGITTQFKSWNPAWANVHYYVEMWQKARNMKWYHKLKIMTWAKPGWMPEYLGGAIEVKPVDESSFKKYDLGTNKYFTLYGIIQFFVLLWGLIQFLSHYSEISTFYKVVFFGLLFVTMLIIGAIFENKRWVIYAEYARLALAMVSLNTYYYFWHIEWLAAMLVISATIFVGCLAFFTYSQAASKQQQPETVAAE